MRSESSSKSIKWDFKERRHRNTNPHSRADQQQQRLSRLAKVRSQLEYDWLTAAVGRWFANLVSEWQKEVCLNPHWVFQGFEVKINTQANTQANSLSLSLSLMLHIQHTCSRTCGGLLMLSRVECHWGVFLRLVGNSDRCLPADVAS